MNAQKKYGITFTITSIVFCLYSFIVKNNFPNDNLGAKQGLGDFFESDFFLCVGFILLFFGSLYFITYKVDKIQLIDKLTARHYWFLFPMLLVLLSIPILDTYFPTSKFRYTPAFSILSAFIGIAVFLFFASFVVFLYNIIKSIYIYFSIRRGWKK